MNQSPTLIGERVILRRPEEKDIDDRFKCGRCYEWVHMLGGDTRKILPYTIDDAIKWFSFIDSNPLEWVIEFEGKCIGTARLTVNEYDRRARYAIGIHDTKQFGKGIGTEVTKMVLDYAFNTLKLHKVDIKVLEYNTRAIACYKKCGFEIEGRDREGALIEDKWETDLIMSILESEYRNNNKLNH